MNNQVPGAIKQQVQQGLSADHHQAYNHLRTILMHLHAQGVPGMDQVLGALNTTHVKLSAPKQGTMTPDKPGMQGGYTV